MAINWPTDLNEAREIQEQLQRQVITTDAFGDLQLIAGVDAGYEGDQAKAAVVVFSYPELTPIEYTLAYRPAPIPYVPGFLSFREAPAVLAALDQLTHKPDLLMCDGQGIAHPRRLGIASHVGVLTDTPSIGCAKSLLCGHHAPVPDERGASVPLIYRGEQIGAVLRSRLGVKPLYISSGHRISLETSLTIVMACLTKYRLPETTRAADALASHGKIPQIQA